MTDQGDALRNSTTLFAILESVAAVFAWQCFLRACLLMRLNLISSLICKGWEILNQWKSHFSSSDIGFPAPNPPLVPYCFFGFFFCVFFCFFLKFITIFPPAFDCVSLSPWLNGLSFSHSPCLPLDFPWHGVNMLLWSRGFSENTR